MGQQAVPSRRCVVCSDARTSGRKRVAFASKLNAPSWPIASSREKVCPASRGSSIGAVV